MGIVLEQSDETSQYLYRVCLFVGKRLGHDRRQRRRTLRWVQKGSADEGSPAVSRSRRRVGMSG
jgi:hypothetical protein